MSCNLTAIILEKPRLIRIHIITKNKLGTTIYLKQELQLYYLFLEKILTQKDKWLIFGNYIIIAKNSHIALTFFIFLLTKH